MTARPDGTVVCDGCGADVGNGSVTAAAMLLVLDSNWQPVNLHLGLGCCTVIRETVADLAWRQTDPASPSPVTVYEPPPPDDNHPDTVSMTSTSVSTTEGNPA